MTLFFSGRLSPPTETKPKWRLVDGVVQRANRTTASAAAGAGALDDDDDDDDDSAVGGEGGEGSEGGADAEEAANAPPAGAAAAAGEEGWVELQDIGTFGANEFEQGLLSDLQRFQPPEAGGAAEAEAGALDGEGEW